MVPVNFGEVNTSPTGIFTDPRREYTRESRFYRRLLDSATAIGLRVCRVRIRTEGLETLPDGPFLLVSIQQSLSGKPLEAMTRKKLPPVSATP